MSRVALLAAALLLPATAFAHPGHAEPLGFVAGLLHPLGGADLSVMDRDSRRMRGTRPFIFTNLKEDKGVAEIAAFILEQGGIAPRRAA